MFTIIEVDENTKDETIFERELNWTEANYMVRHLEETAGIYYVVRRAV